MSTSPLRRMTELLTKHASNRPRNRDHANSNGRLATAGSYFLPLSGGGCRGIGGGGEIDAHHSRAASSSGGFVKDCLSPQQADSNTCSPALGHKNSSRLVLHVQQVSKEIGLNISTYF